MQQIEREYNSEQEFKKDTRSVIVKIASKYIKKHSPMTSDDYFKLEVENVSNFISDITNLVFEKASINIATDKELKAQPRELAETRSTSGQPKRKEQKYR
ncbi:hypothetical protein CCAL13119_07070 [Campylobacter sp. RM13119]|uniref:hypothetical protein n=1 Tax=Campylobacter californiensis TaxID=1032243 RepID=UPI00147541E2|nr:hypothetical protein [Campylobacter sp. RM13119]MBE3606703.1 hypothetical protein [Campylobacter sp. RM13119]